MKDRKTEIPVSSWGLSLWSASPSQGSGSWTRSCASPSWAAPAPGSFACPTPWKHEFRSKREMEREREREREREVREKARRGRRIYDYRQINRRRKKEYITVYSWLSLQTTYFSWATSTCVYCSPPSSAGPGGPWRASCPPRRPSACSTASRTGPGSSATGIDR